MPLVAAGYQPTMKRKVPIAGFLKIQPLRVLGLINGGSRKLSSGSLRPWLVTKYHSSLDLASRNNVVYTNRKGYLPILS